MRQDYSTDTVWPAVIGNSRASRSARMRLGGTETERCCEGRSRRCPPTRLSCPTPSPRQHDTAVARSAPAPQRSCKRDNFAGGTCRRGRRALQRSHYPVSVVSSASGTEGHARVGNASPNIGSPLMDSSAVASNCSTSQCSTSRPSCTRTTSTAIQFAGNPILENRPCTIT